MPHRPSQDPRQGRGHVRCSRAGAGPRVSCGETTGPASSPVSSAGTPPGVQGWGQRSQQTPSVSRVGSGLGELAQGARLGRLMRLCPWPPPQRSVGRPGFDCCPGKHRHGLQKVRIIQKPHLSEHDHPFRFHLPGAEQTRGQRSGRRIGRKLRVPGTQRPARLPLPCATLPLSPERRPPSDQHSSQ